MEILALLLAVVAFLVFGMDIFGAFTMRQQTFVPVWLSKLFMAAVAFAVFLTMTHQFMVFASQNA